MSQNILFPDNFKTAHVSSEYKKGVKHKFKKLVSDQQNLVY